MKLMGWCFQVRRALGIKEGKLPVTGQGWVDVDGVGVKVLSREDAQALNPKSNRPHRVIAMCPFCGREMSAGRFNQHFNKVHNRTRNVTLEQHAVVCKQCADAVFDAGVSNLPLCKTGQRLHEEEEIR